MEYLLRIQVNKLATRFYKQFNYRYILLDAITDSLDDIFIYLDFNIER